MAQYDGAIRIATKITTKDAEESLASLEWQIKKSAKYMDELRSKMDALKDQKIPTKEYKKMQEDLSKAEKTLSDLVKEQTEMESLGLSSGGAWDALNEKVATTSDKVDLIKAKMQDFVDAGKGFTFGKDTAEYAAYEKQLQYEEETVRKAAEHYKKLEDEVSGVTAEEERLAKIRENAVVGSQQIVKIAERRKQLLQEIADMEAAGIGAGYRQYDSAKQEIAEIEQKIKDYNNGIKETKENYKKLGDVVKKAFTTVGNMLKRANSLINSFGKHIKESFSKFTKSATGAVRSANGFSLSLKNILKYGFGIRSLYVLVNKLRSGIKEGFANLLTYSQSLENSVNEIKASALTLKNAFAAAFSPFAEIALPYVQKLLDYMVQLTNIAGQFFAAITGRKTYVKAIKQSTEALKEETKEMYKQLSPLDKLNNLSSQKDKGTDKGAGGTMFEEVPIDSGILDMAEKIKDILSKLFAPLKEAWNREGKFVMDSWKYALDEVWKLIKDIGRDFLEVWQQEKTIKIFQDILHIIGDIGRVVGHLARNFREAWNENKTGLHILENIRDIIGVIVHNIRLAADRTVEWADKLNFKPVLQAFERFTKSLIPLADTLSGVLSDFYTKVLLPLAKWTIEKGLPHLLDVFTAFNEKVDWQALRDNLAEFWRHLEPFAETVGEGLIIFIGRLTEALANFLNSQEFKDFLVTIENWMDSVSPEDVANALEIIAKGLIALKIALIGFEAISAIAGIFTTITTFVSAISALGSIVSSAAAFMAAGIEAIINTVGGIIPILATVAAAVVGWNIGSWIAEKLDLDPQPFNETMQAIKDSFTDGTWKEAMSLWGNDIYSAFVTLGQKQVEWLNSLKNKWLQTWNNIKAGISEAINSIKSTVGSALDWISSKLKSLQSAFSSIGKGFSGGGFGSRSTGAGGASRMSAASTYSANPAFSAMAAAPIPKLATGAVIPPNKEFLAVLGDQRNGTNVEAPLSTIEEALINAMAKVNANNGNNAGGQDINLNLTVECEGYKLIQLIQKLNGEYFKQNGKYAFT